MVRSLALLAVSLGVLHATAHAELILSPMPSSYELEGVKFKRVAFADSAVTVTYQPPRDWEYTGGAAQLTLHPPKKAQAEATITRIPLTEAEPFGEESLKKLVDEVLAAVPKGSTDVELVSQEMNPLKISGKETFAVTLNYTFYGQKFGRSILFLNRGSEQMRFQLTSREEDFKDLQQAFLASHYTWQNL